MKTPAEVRALMIESFNDLRLGTEERRDTIDKLIKSMDQSDPNWASAQTLHRSLSNSIRILDAGIKELEADDEDDVVVDQEDED
jgi:hypothetical protein